nr:M48 family peptidase [Bacteroidales bacterium]
MKKFRILIIFLLVLSTSCSNVPLTGRKQFTAIPNSQMLTLSADSYSQVLAETPISENAQYIE